MTINLSINLNALIRNTVVEKKQKSIIYSPKAGNNVLILSCQFFFIITELGFLMILYVYSKCSTCQKALKFLEENKIDFIQKEITQTPPSIAELKSMLKFMNGNVRKLFNSSGQLYREMELSEKLKMMPEEEALNLLSGHGMLVKRPFLISDQLGLIGFNEPLWAKTLT